MKKLVFKFLLLLGALFMNVPGWCAVELIDGIYYDLYLDSPDDSSPKARVSNKNAVGVMKGELKIAGDIVIPETVEFDGKVWTVVSMDYNAFLDCQEMTSIALPATLEYFYRAFFGKNETVCAFNGCASLKSISVDPENPWMCSENGVLFNHDRTELYAYPAAREGDYVIPSSVTGIKNSAFFGCTGLTSVVVPEGVTTIGSSVFANCVNLKNAVLPDGLTSVSGFQGCSSLSEVNLPLTLQRIGESAFYECGNLSGINIPESVVSIDKNAFYGCSSLKEVSLPQSLSGLGDYAFYGCSSLKEIVFPSAIQVLQGNVVGNCSGLEKITISDGISKIVSSAFNGCTSLKSVFIPASVTTITGGIGNGCSALQEIAVDSQNSHFCASDNILYTKEKDLLVRCPEGVEGEIKLASGVKRIGTAAFLNCTKLTGVLLPQSLTAIDGAAFSGCSSIQEMEIPESITKVSASLFKNCSGLTRIVLPETILTIENSAFYGCSSLRSLTIPASVQTINNIAFCDCKITSLKLLCRLGDYTSANHESLKGLSEESVIYAYEAEIPFIREAFGGKVLPIDNELTGIWNTESAPVSAFAIFDIQGHKVAKSQGNTLPKGVYIQNGRKFIVK